MTQYISLKVKLSNSQLNKLKSAIKNETEAVLRLSSSMICNSDDETNFSHKLLLTNRQVANLQTTFANNSSTDIKLSKTGLALTKNVIKLLTKTVLVPLALTAAASAADVALYEKS